MPFFLLGAFIWLMSVQFGVIWVAYDIVGQQVSDFPPDFFLHHASTLFVPLINLDNSTIKADQDYVLYESCDYFLYILIHL